MGEAHCEVCERNLVGNWTDLNGEIECMSCGAPHQILRDPKGCNLNEEFIPIVREYFNETGSACGLGCYCGTRPLRVQEQYDGFLAWMKVRHPELLTQNIEATT